MKKGIFCVRDNVANHVESIWLAPNIEVAKRIFGDACRTSNLGLHAEDFELWQIGAFDEELISGVTGDVLCIYEDKRFICFASEFFKDEVSPAGGGTMDAIRKAFTKDSDRGSSVENVNEA